MLRATLIKSPYKPLDVMKKVYEITLNGKTHFVRAFSKADIKDFFNNPKPTFCQLRKDIPSDTFGVFDVPKPLVK